MTPLHSSIFRTARKWLALVIGALCFTGHGYAEKTVTDPVGRQLQIPDHPVRIVSLAPSITEIIFDLGQQHRLVGVTRYSNYPEAARLLPRVGSYIRPDLEKIMALQPDLCIAIKDGNPIVVVNRLTELGIPVYAVDPRNIAAVMETTRAIGNLLGATEETTQLLNNMQNRMNRIKTRISNIRSRPRVFLQIGISPMVSVGPNTLADEMITLAGGQNVVEGNAQYPVYSTEQILGLAPEVYIITSMAREKVFEDVKAEWQQWQQMPAVRDQRIYLINSDLTDRPSPRLLDGLECIAAAIHPDLFDFQTLNCREP